MLAHPSRPVDTNHATYDGEQLRRASDGAALNLHGGFVTHIVFCPGVTAIHENAFRGCTSLSSFSIPESVSLVYTQSDYYTEGNDGVAPNAFVGCTLLYAAQRSEEHVRRTSGLI